MPVPACPHLAYLTPTFFLCLPACLPACSGHHHRQAAWQGEGHRARHRHARRQCRKEQPRLPRARWRGGCLAPAPPAGEEERVRGGRGCVEGSSLLGVEQRGRASGEGGGSVGRGRQLLGGAAEWISKGRGVVTSGEGGGQLELVAVQLSWGAQRSQRLGCDQPCRTRLSAAPCYSDAGGQCRGRCVPPCLKLHLVRRESPPR